MTTRLTVAQAIVRFLEQQYVERDGVETPFFAGCWGIFGHGNVAGVGQALLEREHAGERRRAPEHVLRYHQARNEQAMVHAAVGYARHRDRLAAFACTASVGPGSTNMVTGAALATINRIPVLLLPGDVFATRVANPVLQELEDPRSLRRQRQRLLQAGLALLGPDQPARAAARCRCSPRCGCSPTRPRPARSPSRCRRTCRPRRGTGRTTCSPGGCGTSPASRSPSRRRWPARSALIRSARAAARRRRRRRHLLRRDRRAPRVRRGDRRTRWPRPRPARAACRYDHPQSVGAIGATGTTAADALAAEADVVIGVGTRYSDFTTGVQDRVRATRTCGSSTSTWRRSTRTSSSAVAAGRRRPRRARAAHRGPGRLDRPRGALPSAPRGWPREWDDVVQRSYDLRPRPAAGPVRGDRRGQPTDPRPQDVVVCAAGSMPGDLHKLWRTRDRKGYHVEYGFSCMGYEIAGGLGVKMAALDAGEDRDVVVMVGDGSYLMMCAGARHRRAGGRQADRGPGAEPRLRLDRRALGVARVAALRHPLPLPHRRPGSTATCSRSTWPRTPPASAPRDSGERRRRAREGPRRRPRPSDVHDRDPHRDRPAGPGPGSPAWWDVPVAEVSALESHAGPRARRTSEHKARQRSHLRPPTTGRRPRRREPMRTIDHWVGGKADGGDGHPSRPGLEPGDR